MSYTGNPKHRRIVILLERTDPLVEAIAVAAARAGKAAPAFIRDELAAGACAEELARIEARRTATEAKEAAA
jgi:hypothetical protein